MTMLRKLSVAVAALLLTPALHAQGILTITPGRTVATTAGTTGVVGYSGDNGVATNATLALPSAVAYDKLGNFYIADANNHAVRYVNAVTHVITTVAGTGIAGFSGDGGPATSAQLDTPTGVAVDLSGNLYIADSHNNRIRKVSSGTITTIAGTGVADFGGDNAAATAALLNLPSGVAVDLSGNVYIADTNNQRIRKIANGTITTIAGTGEQGYAGDNGAATAALLDSPTSIAVDLSGNVYIADRHNQHVRQIVASSGNIINYAGSGAPTFGGGYGGDGGSATAAQLANPTGVSTDIFGKVYIADTNNQRIREVAGAAINTAVGDGTQSQTTLDSPRGVANDFLGNLSLADTHNQRIQGSVLFTLNFANAAVGIASATQTVTLSNTGTASITVSTITFAGPFTTAPGGTCSAAPITLAAGASCTQNIEFLPSAIGAATGSVSFGGSGIVTESVLLAANATIGSTTTTLTSNFTGPFINTPVTFTATVTPVGAGATAPTGTVNILLNGTTVIGTGTISATSNTVTATYTFTTGGSYSLSAVYAGDANYAGSTGTFTQPVGDFNFTLSPAGNNPPIQSVKPGDTAAFNFTVAPLNGPFTFPITLSATGLPPGATVTFVPQTITLGSSPAVFTMYIKTAPLTGMLERVDGMNGIALAFIVLLVPISRRQRRKGRAIHPLLLLLVGFGSLITMGALSGCGANSGFFGQQPHTYTINVIGTANGANGTTLQHVTTVQLTIQ